MPENCNANDRPVAVRVDALEKEFDRYRKNFSDTHRQMFARIGAPDAYPDGWEIYTGK